MPPRVFFVASAAAAAALVLSGCSGSDSDEAAGSSSESATAEGSSSEKAVAAVETRDDIDIGGRTLYLRCSGERVPGEPTILLMSGHEESTASWDPMAGDFAATGHWVCSYDRAGIGRSQPAPEARRTTKDQVADLVALLNAADLEEPVVLVAHSAGSMPAIGLAAKAPDLIAAVVFVDPLVPRLGDVQRAALPPEKPGESQELAHERAFLTEAQFDPTSNREKLVLAQGSREAVSWLEERGPLFGDRPVVVLQAPHPDFPGLPKTFLAAEKAAIDEGNQELAAESAHGSVVQVEDTGHFIMIDRPDAVIDAILDVIAES